MTAGCRGAGGRTGPGLEERVERLAVALERMNLADYADLTRRPWRLFWVNFAAGTARGLGMAFGFTVVAAAVLRLAALALQARVPHIGGLIADIVRMVRLNLGP
ncbi:DUF5665 domain-containing protein [Caldinitratiruptor microaerophilus]|uniref:Uncharacterized protein n=1 Tax=Caldinitratiruptor microaerophilus TaxID=671077 RepID=A0AA35G854_9FIRM|nr:DUF5665 domain-containing protein [Caldinitratiruptor microaerophilus]BDG60726.1 hypothetical protein caldi_18160 [Caldinitratiruptor microaerophilus]